MSQVRDLALSKFLELFDGVRTMTWRHVVVDTTSTNFVGFAGIAIRWNYVIFRILFPKDGSCYVVAMRLLCSFYVVAMRLLCGCYAVVIGLQCW